jgi:DNA-binding transcriptional ArsR family regulator
MGSGAATPILRVDTCPAYECVLSLLVWSDTAHHALYATESDWLDTVRRSESTELLTAIERFAQHSDVVWSHIIGLAYDCPPPRDMPALLAYMQTLDPIEVRLRLLGYYEREVRRNTSPEVIAAALAGDPKAQYQFLQTACPDDAPWHAALEHLLPKTPEDTKDTLLWILGRWYDEVFQVQASRLLEVIAREADATRLVLSSVPALSMDEVLERVTNGCTYVPEPGIRQLVLIPSLVTRPVVRTIDHHAVKLIVFPVSDETMRTEGEEPPPRLVRLLKAVSEERRLRLLKRLTTGEHTQHQLSTHLSMSKTLTRHHLVVLRAAGLVRVRTSGSTQQYGLRSEAVADIGPLLSSYLGDASL